MTRTNIFLELQPFAKEAAAALREADGKEPSPGEIVDLLETFDLPRQLNPENAKLWGALPKEAQRFTLQMVVEFGGV